MAKKKSVRRENGRGTVEKTSSKKNPFKAKVAIGTKIDKNGKTQAVYKSLGNFTTRREAEEALLMYSNTPYDLSGRINTFQDLYEVWSESYFKTLESSSSIRTVTSAYAYCSGLYHMPIRQIGPGHIRDTMEKGYVIPTTGKDKGKKKYASLNTKERIKSLCNLLFDYAVERRLIISNPARAFKIGDLLNEIKKKSKGKIPFTQDQVNELWKYVDEIPFADMVLIALYTGFRPQELALIEIENVILNEDKIIGGMKTENGKDREIPIHPMIKPLIEKRYNQAIDRFHSDRLFNDPRGQVSTKMTYDMYRGRFKNVMAEMGFVGFTPHCTRHTFSTQAKRCGMDSGIRKRIMGHSLAGDITESVYTHPSFEDLKTEMNKLDYSVMTYI